IKGRDNARTPMQWDDQYHAGFTTGEPWITVNPNYKEINVKQAIQDEGSIFYYYKKLIELRKNNEIVVYGSYDLILDNSPSIFAYV
ncbi:glucohydrolase, partial [Peribacillus simplex]